MVYGTEIDVWSAGCIFAELLQGQPLFGKHEEREVFDAICEELGSPDPEEWPEVVRLSGWESVVKNNREHKLRDTIRKNTLRVRQVRAQYWVLCWWRQVRAQHWVLCWLRD